MNFFEEATLRLKQQLKTTQDKEVASALGLSAQSWAGRKKREKFPEKELRALAQQRPDLGVDVEFVLTGGSLSPQQQQVQRLAKQFTATQSVSPEDKAKLLEKLDGAGLEMARDNARRDNTYAQITDVLRMCSDDTVGLVATLVGKLYRAELEESQSKKVRRNER